MMHSIIQFKIFHTIAIVLINIVGIYLLTVVSPNSKKLKTNLLFVLMVFVGIFGWVDFAYFSRIVTNLFLSILFIKIAWFVTPLFFVLLYYFSIYLVKEQNNYKILNKLIFSLGLSFSFIIGFTNFIVDGVVIRQGELVIIYGTWMWPFLIAISFILFSTLFILFKKYPRLTREKNRVKFYFIGLFIFYIANLIFNISLPIFLNIIEYYYYGDYSIIILLSFISYSIVRYRLIDIRVGIRKGFVYLGLGFFVYITFYLVAFLFTFTWGSVFAKEAFMASFVVFVIVAILFSFFQKYLKVFVNRYLYASVYNTQKALGDLSNRLNSIVEIEDILHSIFHTLRETLAVDRLAIIIKNSNGKNYKIVRNDSFECLNNKKIFYNSFLINWFNNTKRLIVLEELEAVIPNILDVSLRNDLQKLMNKMEKLDINLCLPMMRHDKLVGLILFGKKINKEAYSEGDVSLLNLVANQAAGAIENAQLYSEMEEVVKSKTRELRCKNKNLKELLEAKSSFLSVASHQLRTPVSIAKSMLSMLVSGTLPKDKQKYFTERSFVAVDRLSNVIHDLLSASAIDGSNFKLNKSLTDIDELINKVIEERMAMVEEKKIKLIYNKSKEKIPQINIDANKIKETITNFIDNAIQYTFKGGIEINTKIEDNNFVFTIKDTGIGIAKKDIPKLFKKVSRLPSAIQVRAEGTGLGLFFAKHVILAHKGKVKVYSDNIPGKGSSFVFWLPINQGK